MVFDSEREAAMSASAPRVIAEFVPQAWVNDCAIEVDPQEPREWDVTIEVIEKGPDFRWQDDMPDSDELRTSDLAPAWASDWGGPFYVRVEQAASDFWLAVEQDGLDVAEIRAECEAERAGHAPPAPGR
jgi:hypothetical protein